VASDTRAAGAGATADVEAPAFAASAAPDFAASAASCWPEVVGWLVVGRVVELVDDCDVVGVDCGVVEFCCDAAVVGEAAAVAGADVPVIGADVLCPFGADVVWPFGAAVGSVLLAAGLVCASPSVVVAVSVVAVVTG
jgi:hypothetical protein